MTRRRLFAPQVVQTSAMDCGPAALCALLGGFGVQASYGRLREACQTDVDGTSIDTLETLAVRLGLDAEQVMIPADHLPIESAGALPAIVVVRQPDGFTHFVVAWRWHGPWLQLMDPGVGRRYVHRDQFLRDVYVHKMPVPASAWRDWASDEGNLAPLRRRLGELGVSTSQMAAHLATACGDPGWRGLGSLDAAIRAVSRLVRTGGLHRGAEAQRVLGVFFERARIDESALPDEDWTVRGAAEEDREAQVEMRGAVLVRVLGRKAPAADDEPLPVELQATLSEPPATPVRTVLGWLADEGRSRLARLGLMAVLAAGLVTVEAALLRALVDLVPLLGRPLNRALALLAVLVFVAARIGLERALVAGLQGGSRRVESRFRMRFLEKVPRLGDRYFRSRPASDMAERAHAAHHVRAIPELAMQWARATLEATAIAGGLIWLLPTRWPVVLGGYAAATLLPWLVRQALEESDMRQRVHHGALVRFHLDTLLGLSAVRAHGAAPTLAAHHEGLLTEWARTVLGGLRIYVGLEALQAAAGLTAAVVLIAGALSAHETPGTVLLVAWWALSLPAVGQRIGEVARAWPVGRNVAARLLEPLGAPDETGDVATNETPPQTHGPVSLDLQDVTVLAAGHPILEGVSLSIAPGEHVAVVGPSGAGKSSLLGLFLGWHRASAGTLLADGAPLDAAALSALRAQTAWIDPGVQLWNQSLIENVAYGTDGRGDLGAALDRAELTVTIARLPDGLATPLGDAGALISGGEGQRVRVARALSKGPVRLVLMDEPFRGLEHDRRDRLLESLRQNWAGATWLYVTHDLEQVHRFGRVLVIEGGRVVEDGAPAALAAQPDSAFRRMLDVAQADPLATSPKWARHEVRDRGVVAVGAP